MKNLFFALALTGIVGAASVNTVSAMTHSKVVVNVGQDEKKVKSKKKKSCCKSKSNTAAESKSVETKCCTSKSASQTGSCHGKSTPSETKTDVKMNEQNKME